MEPKLQIIGWKEAVDLPDWQIRHILTKADTGARASAIDVRSIVHLECGKVRFDIILHRKEPQRTQTIVAPIVREKRVRSSNGQMSERIVVATTIRLGGVTREIELSLVCRRRMICRMLLGRAALEGAFLVDSGRKYVASRRRVPRSYS